jgi:RNA-directed DNA polymerase
MNSSQYKVNELKKLCSIIGFKPKQVEQIVLNIDHYYKEWIEKKVDKKTGDFKRYIDGTIKERTLRPSQNELKKIQANIKDKIFGSIQFPENVHGGVKQRSNISNAKSHQGRKYQFTTDLQEFYPNITPQRVYDSFLGLGFSSHFSHWLTKLTTWKYELPQGAPTSPVIANIVFLGTDFELISLCEHYGITYTRYVDDLTFSSQQDFKNVLDDILQIITKNNFKLNYRKTRYKGNQTITGIEVFLNKIDAPETIRKKAQEEVSTGTIVKPYTNYLNNIRKTNNVKKDKTKPVSR